VPLRAVPLVFLALTWGVAFSVAAEQSGREQLLHYSLQVDVDEEARSQLAASEAELARGDVLTAVSRWRALLDSKRTGGLVPYRGAFASIPTVIAETVRSLPGAVREDYLRITEPLAARALADAIAKDDLAALSSVRNRFPGTVASLEAPLHLAERCFDAGRFAECRLAVDRWFESVRDPRASVAKHPQMVVWRRLSLLALGDIEAADERWSDFAPLIPVDLKQTLAAYESMQVASPRGQMRPLRSTATDLTEVLPSDEIIWEAPLSNRLDGEASALVADFEKLAQPLLMVARPAAVSNGLVVSGRSQGLIDPKTGEAKWAIPSAAVTSGDPRRMWVDALRAALGESVDGRMTIADGRVLTVRDFNDPQQGNPPGDHLCVNSLADGSELRVIHEFPVPSSRAPQPATLLGPPGAGHGQIYAAVQFRSEISIAAFESESMQPRWRMRLGDAGLDLAVDHRRRWMPAVFDAAFDSVFCATGNGAVVSLEPVGGRVQWIHRSEREDWRNAGPPQVTAVSNAPRFRMWTGWREPVLKRMGDVVIWAGPEAETLLGLDARTGQVRWSHPRGDGLAVAATGEALLVISQENVRRLNAADGTTIWSAPVPPPSGLGFTAGDWYVQPLRSGGSVALRLKDGSPTRSVAWRAEVARQSRPPLDELRSLTWTPDGVLVQTPGSLSLHRTVAAVRAAGTDKGTTPESLAAAGRLGDARQAIGDSDAEARMQRLRLQLIERETEAQHFHLIDRPFERLPQVSVNQESQERIATFLVDRRFETAVELLAGTPIDELASLWLESNRTPRRRLRVDVLASRTIEERGSHGANAVVSLSPADHARLNELLKRVAAERPDDLSKVLNLLSRTDWGVSQILDRQTGRAAAAGDPREAARRRLTLLALEARGGESAARAGKLAASLQPPMTPLTAWPGGEPVAEEPRPWKSLIGQWPAQFTPIDHSELAGLSIDVLLTGFGRRSGMGVHFTGCGQDRPWEIDLPKNDRSLSQSADYRGGIGIGPLVVMQVATGLHGLLPLNAAGERQATKLWDVPWIDMWGNVATQSVSYLPRLSDVAPGRHPLDLDEFGRPLAQLGPVAPSFFCYREFGRLVCCDTATGRRRWDRAGYEPDAIAVGEQTAIVVVSPSAERVEILDPLDGQVVASRSMNFSAAHWRTAIGTTAYLRSGAREERAIPATEPSEPSEIVAVDLLTGERRWTRGLDPAAVEFVVGRRLLGAVGSGSIQFFDRTTGAEKQRIPIEAPREIAYAAAVDDPFAVMVCVFGPPAVEQLRPPLALLGNRRKPYANGVVYGFDPETLELKWTIPLERSVFPLDQPRDIPLLVIHDATAVVAQPDLEFRADRFRCFDKRTGRQIGPERGGELVTPSGIVIERSHEAGWVDVRTSKGVFRYQYGEQK
jgi:outer membrane protein assembly factor BamB